MNQLTVMKKRVRSQETGAESAGGVNPWAISFADLSESLVISISKLNERERDILKKRFDDREEKIWTLAELGELYGISRERVRQIEQNAIRKLRKALDEKFGESR